MAAVLTLAELDELYHAQRVYFSESLRLCIHRSLSWLKKAATLNTDPDLQFITSWIAFNALYGRQMNQSTDDKPLELQGRERLGFKRFLIKLCGQDDAYIIYDTLWIGYAQSIRTLLNNRYTYQTYWNYLRGQVSADELDILWQENQRLVHQALSHRNSGLLSGLLFDRIYTLRNQLLHGAATYQSQVNRAQIKDSCRILGMLIPAFIQIMLHHYHAFDDGLMLYPVID